MGLQFDVFNYEKYDTYFDDSSMITLAQAGVYVGPSNIQEYVGFTDAISPYVAARKVYDNQVDLAGYDPTTGICKFSSYSVSGVDFDPNMTNGDTLNYGVIVNIYYSIPTNKVEQAHVFYTPEAIEAVFTRFRTDRVDDFICDTLLSSSCLDALGDSAEEGLTKQECQRRLAKLPLAEGDENYFDSNSHSCRAMHATFATENPTHCAHIAFAPTEDPNGKIKCQESADVSPSDFFAQAEIDRLLGICANSTEVDDNCFRAIPNPAPTNPPKKKCRRKEKRNAKVSFKVKRQQQGETVVKTIKRKCSWIANFKRTADAKSYCRKRNLDAEPKNVRKIVADTCPETCGKLGVGKCRFLKNQ